MTADTMIQVPISKLRISSLNARKNTESGQEDSSIPDLAQSIREHGLLNPLTVYPTPDGEYEIIAGQRRFLACKHLALENVAVIVRAKGAETGAIALSLIENVQRADMHPLDKAEAYRALQDHHKGNLSKVAKATGVTISTIQKYLHLLRLPPELQQDLGTGQGSAGVGAMAGIAKTFDDPDDMVQAYNEIGGFRQDIQSEILKRSGGDVRLLPELVMQASEGAFEISRCGSSATTCPHIPVQLRGPLRQAIEALESGSLDPAESLRDFAGRHKKSRN